jgi:hypothetical protein
MPIPSVRLKGAIGAITLNKCQKNEKTSTTIDRQNSADILNLKRQETAEKLFENPHAKNPKPPPDF